MGYEILLTLYYAIPIFNDPANEAIWERCGENEKLLVTSISSFSQYVEKVWSLEKNRWCACTCRSTVFLS